MTDDRLCWPPLVALEGPSGVGKTTLLLSVARRLVELGIPFEAVSNNDSGRWGPVIRDLAARPDRAWTLALATAAARAELREGARQPQLCDRYVLSTLVYQVFAGIPSDFLYSANRPLLTGAVTFVLRLGADELEVRRRTQPHRSDCFKGRLDIVSEIELYDRSAAFLAENGHAVFIVDAATEEANLAAQISSEIASLWSRIDG